MNAEKSWIVYLVRCADASLYCGITNNLKKRLAAHNLGKGAKYTRSRRPVDLLGASSTMTKSDALKLEYRIKRTPAGRKRVELENWAPRSSSRNAQILLDIESELQTVVRHIQQLSRSIDKCDAAIKKLAGTDSSPRMSR